MATNRKYTMNRIIVLTSLILLGLTNVNAQKKSDLLKEIEKLRKEVSDTKGQLAESKKNERVSETRVKTIETQLKDLQETNDKLLGQMSGFTQLSNQKAKNLETSLDAIKQKDKQLNTINEALSKTDSTNLTVISKFKNVIGDNIKMKEGIIYIPIPNNVLFGENDKSYTIDAKGYTMLEKIAKVIKGNKGLKIKVEGNSNALKLDGKTLIDNWDLSARQAAAVVRAFQKKYKVNPKHMQAVGRSEYDTEGIETVTKIIIDPKFDEFYVTIKENMKEAAKE